MRIGRHSPLPRAGGAGGGPVRGGAFPPPAPPARGRGARTALIIATALALAACGKQQHLKPLAGRALPPKPATSPTQPSPDALLASSPTQRPGRSDELVTRSQTRPDDRFDLPPQ